MDSTLPKTVDINVAKIDLTPQEVVESLQRAYKGSTWFIKAELGADDGGSLIGIYTKKHKLKPQLSTLISNHRCVIYLMP